jgi:hypothetical protein
MMNLRSCVRAKFVIGIAAVATVAGIGLTALPAGASVSPRATLAVPAGASVSPRATPACSPFWVKLSGQVIVTVCGVTTRNLSGPDQYTELLISGHANRVWLHQNPSGVGGWARCFEGENRSWTLDDPYRNPGNVQVSSNTAPCS